MAIRIRVIDGVTIAICAARSVEKEGDIYLDDAAHYALSTKFALDFMGNFGGDLPFEHQEALLMQQEEDNNPNREWWDSVYGNTPHTVIPSHREPEKSHRDWSRKSIPPPPIKRP